MKSKLTNIILTAAVGILAVACDDDVNLPVKENTVELPDVEDTVSGEPYDYTQTMQPERPYMLDYSQMMMMKFHLASPDRKGGSQVFLSYDDALEYIKGLDAISRGLPKVVYLVGWQYEGHDCKYPAMDEFNETLKRPEDATAADSFFWLREQASRYNTIVSIHTLISDAYTDSPLWHDYVKNGFICRDANGDFVSPGILNGQPMYYVDNYTEWKKGWLQKRLDRVVDLCRIQDVKTIHIDAFQPHENVYLDVTYDMAEEVCRKVIRYLRDKGIDVTGEFWHGTTRNDTYIGLQAGAWWNDLTCHERAAIPASLSAGGRSGQFSWNTNPEAAFLFGDNMMAETTLDAITYNGIGKRAVWAELKSDFCLMTLPYMYYNRHTVVEYQADAKRVIYSDGLTADYGRQTVTQGNMTLRDRNNVFIPALWVKDRREIIAYSANGYNGRRWVLPADWAGVTEVTMCPLDENGVGDPVTLPVTNNSVTFSLSSGRMAVISAN